MLVAINYHYIRPSFECRHPAIFGLTPAQFEAHLRFLGQIGNFIGAEQIHAALLGCELDPKSLVITFDDGLREQYDYAWPILRRLGIPAIFFINTAPIAEEKVLTVHQIHLLREALAPELFLHKLHEAALDLGVDIDLKAEEEKVRAQYHYDDPETGRLKYLLNIQLDWETREKLVRKCFEESFPGMESSISRKLYMTIEQIRELADFGCLGNHTHSHLPLGLLPESKAMDEISRAHGHLKEWTGSETAAMSYPYGGREACSGPAGKAAEENCIKFAFTMERAGNRRLEFPLHLARIDNNDSPGGKSSRWPASLFFESIPCATWGSTLSNHASVL